MEFVAPTSWEEEDIHAALLLEAADPDSENFSLEEIRFLAKSIFYYMSMPAKDWGELFSINIGEIDLDDPEQEVRSDLFMVYPEHLEPPASLLID